jgi:hypothetical protein
MIEMIPRCCGRMFAHLMMSERVGNHDDIFRTGGGVTLLRLNGELEKGREHADFRKGPAGC